MTRSILLIVAWLVSGNIAAQLKLDSGYYSRLVVPEGTYAEVMQVVLEVDTLIMEDNSSLRFTELWHRLTINHAKLRGEVSWKGAGKPGEDEGSPGENCATLSIRVIFHELGRLVIDTRGGAGSRGKTPKAKTGYINLARPGNGGNGGDGGDVTLTYRCLGFTPRFDKGKKNAIHFKIKGGAGGSGGFSNMGSNQYSAGSNPKISSGPQGEVGDKGRDGEVVVKEM